MARVTGYIHVRGTHGESAVLAPGDTVPDWATVTNPAVLEDDAEAPEAPADTPEDEAPEAEAPETPEPAPAPRKRTARKADTASE